MVNRRNTVITAVIVGVAVFIVALILTPKVPLDAHVCTISEKQAEACTLEYLPVCGDDGVTYGNDCAACASKNVTYWINGECPA